MLYTTGRLIYRCFTAPVDGADNIEVEIATDDEPTILYLVQVSRAEALREAAEVSEQLAREDRFDDYGDEFGERMAGRFFVEIGDIAPTNFWPPAVVRETEASAEAHAHKHLFTGDRVVKRREFVEALPLFVFRTNWQQYEGGLMSTAQAAKYVGHASDASIRVAIRDGRLTAHKIGRNWMVTRAALDLALQDGVLRRGDKADERRTEMWSRTMWVSAARLSELRAAIRECPNPDYREEGLACLRGVRRGEYLTNLIPQDHPDRVGIVRWLTQKK